MSRLRGWLQRINRTLLLSYVLFALSALILIGVLLTTMKVEVLKDWRLILPDGNFHAGDTIVVQSLYTKLRPVTGHASRYVECQNNNKLFVRYTLNEAVADHAPGSAGTGIVIKLPTSVPSLPTTCRISVTVSYKVYPWRTVTDFASTRDFTLLPEPSGEPAVVSQPSSKTSPALAVSPGLQNQGVSSGSSSKGTAEASSSQPEISQPPSQANLLQDASGLVMRAVPVIIEIGSNK